MYNGIFIIGTIGTFILLRIILPISITLIFSDWLKTYQHKKVSTWMNSK
jgi:hypothetical protein